MVTPRAFLATFFSSLRKPFFLIGFTKRTARRGAFFHWAWGPHARFTRLSCVSLFPDGCRLILLGSIALLMILSHIGTRTHTIHTFFLVSILHSVYSTCLFGITSPITEPNSARVADFRENGPRETDGHNADIIGCDGSHRSIGCA